jgi:hypothetical protein
VLLLYMDCYSSARTHLSLNKDAQVPQAIQAVREPNPWRFTSSLCSELISDRDTGEIKIAWRY